jgi:predicted dehydrogenase
MQEVEAATGRFAAVGFQEVYSPHARSLKQRLLAGELGRVRSMRGRGLWPRSFDYYGRNNWAGRLRVGDHWVLDSPLNNALSHYLHLLLFLAGSTLAGTARPLSLQGELYRAQAIESFDTGGVRIDTDSGIPILFLGTHSSRGLIHPELIIETDKGRVEWSVHGECRIFLGGSDQPVEVSPPRGDQRTAMAESVLARVSDPEAFICTTESASAHTLIVNGLHESIPIRDFPSELVETIDDAEGHRTVVNSLDEALDNAFRSNRLLSETEIPWAQAGRSIDLTRLTRFPADG